MRYTHLRSSYSCSSVKGYPDKVALMLAKTWPHYSVREGVEKPGNVPND